MVGDFRLQKAHAYHMMAAEIEFFRIIGEEDMRGVLSVGGSCVDDERLVRAFDYMKKNCDGEKGYAKLMKEANGIFDKNVFPADEYMAVSKGESSGGDVVRAMRGLVEKLTVGVYFRDRG